MVIKDLFWGWGVIFNSDWVNFDHSPKLIFGDLPAITFSLFAKSVSRIVSCFFVQSMFDGNMKRLSHSGAPGFLPFGPYSISEKLYCRSYRNLCLYLVLPYFQLSLDRSLPTAAWVWTSRQVSRVLTFLLLSFRTSWSRSSVTCRLFLAGMQHGSHMFCLLDLLLLSLFWSCSNSTYSSVVVPYLELLFCVVYAFIVIAALHLAPGVQVCFLGR